LGTPEAEQTQEELNLELGKLDESVNKSINSVKEQQRKKAQQTSDADNPQEAAFSSEGSSQEKDPLVDQNNRSFFSQACELAAAAIKPVKACCSYLVKKDLTEEDTSNFEKAFDVCGALYVKATKLVSSNKKNYYERIKQKKIATLQTGAQQNHSLSLDEIGTALTKPSTKWHDSGWRWFKPRKFLTALATPFVAVVRSVAKLADLYTSKDELQPSSASNSQDEGQSNSEQSKEQQKSSGIVGFINEKIASFSAWFKSKKTPTTSVAPEDPVDEIAYSDTESNAEIANQFLGYDNHVDQSETADKNSSSKFYALNNESVDGSLSIHTKIVGKAIFNSLIKSEKKTIESLYGLKKTGSDYQLDPEAQEKIEKEVEEKCGENALAAFRDYRDKLVVNKSLIEKRTELEKEEALKELDLLEDELVSLSYEGEWLSEQLPENSQAENILLSGGLKLNDIKIKKTELENKYKMNKKDLMNRIGSKFYNPELLKKFVEEKLIEIKRNMEKPITFKQKRTKDGNNKSDSAEVTQRKIERLINFLANKGESGKNIFNDQVKPWLRKNLEDTINTKDYFVLIGSLEKQFPEGAELDSDEEEEEVYNSPGLK
jgi:hypothetical protein